MTPGSQGTFIIIGVQEMHPAGAEQLPRSDVHIVIPTLIHVLGIAVWPCNPHNLRHGLCKCSKMPFPCAHRLLAAFLILDVYTGSDPQQDHATVISLSHPTVNVPAVD